MKRLFIILSIVVFIFLSCSESTGPDSEKTAIKYIPLEAGNKWEYRNVIYDTTANQILDTTTTYREIIESYNWQGNTVFEQIYIQGNDTTLSYLFYKNKEIRTYPAHPEDTNFYNVILKEPIESGAKWNYKPDNPEDTLYITSASTNALVPAGYFEDCIKICMKGEDCCGNYVIYAYETGEVEYLDFNSKGWIRRELIEKY